jgi:hypothetical protein
VEAEEAVEKCAMDERDSPTQVGAGDFEDAEAARAAGAGAGNRLRKHGDAEGEGGESDHLLDPDHLKHHMTTRAPRDERALGIRVIVATCR